MLMSWTVTFGSLGDAAQQITLAVGVRSLCLCTGVYAGEAASSPQQKKISFLL